MDDYAKYYYQRIGSDKGDFGDISGRVQLRQDLGCKSFQWYLDNIFPELVTFQDKNHVAQLSQFLFHFSVHTRRCCCSRRGKKL